MSSTAWGLLIGIDRYKYSRPNFPDAEFHDLRGAAADVEDMRGLLEQTFGFAPERVITLINEQATHDAILETIRSHLSLQAQPDDIVVIHFSGHGSYRWDAAAGVREGTLVAHDSRGTGAPDILGSTLRASLAQIAARHVALLLDCCHAGNLIGARAAGWSRSIPPDPRLFASPSQLSGEVFSRGVFTCPAGAPYALLAAAGPLELAQESWFDGMGYRGVFTTWLARRARQLETAATYRDLMETVRQSVRTTCGFQTPQLEGSLADSAVFDTTERAAPQYVLASPAGDNLVRLEAGAAAGVTAGSLYAIFPPRSKTFAPAQSVAEVEVTEVRMSDSLATLASGAAIQPASRAVERSHFYVTPKVRVFVSGADGLAPLLERHEHLRLVTAADEMDTCDLIVGAAHIELPKFGMIAPQPKGSMREDVEQPFRREERRVLHWAKWLNLLRIGNHQSSLRLDFEVGNEAVGRSADTATFDSDAEIPYVIANRSGVALFVAVLAFGDDGSVAVVYPGSAGPQVLMSGETRRETLRIAMEPSRESEKDILKLVATSSPCDFRFLEMGASRGARGQDALEQAFNAAAFGTRALVPRIASDWTTREIEIVVNRRP